MLLQYAAVDKSGRCIAVAGRTGIAHYSLNNRKWKLFGNVSQVQRLLSMTDTGFNPFTTRTDQKVISPHTFNTFPNKKMFRGEKGIKQDILLDLTPNSQG